jgi:hypothetical protein
MQPPPSFPATRASRLALSVDCPPDSSGPVAPVSRAFYEAQHVRRVPATRSADDIFSALPSYRGMQHLRYRRSPPQGKQRGQGATPPASSSSPPASARRAAAFDTNRPEYRRVLSSPTARDPRPVTRHVPVHPPGRALRPQLPPADRLLPPEVPARPDRDTRAHRRRWPFPSPLPTPCTP